MAVTKLANLINPEVMADIISAKIDNAIVVTPFAKVDATLAGQPGSTITVPQYSYIGDAVDVAEGATIADAVLSATPVTYTVKKAAKGVTLTDEAVLSGYGNPEGETATQLAKSIASKVDADAIDALSAASTTYTDTGVISYAGVVNGIDKFEEELNTSKVLFVHPKQVTQLRLDPNFISADKYSGNVIMSGEIGMIANARVVPSRRVKVSGNYYLNPIVKIEEDDRTEDEVPALTIYTKRDTNVETERDTHTRTTFISADRHYVVALTNAAKVVVAKFLKTAGA